MSHHFIAISSYLKLRVVFMKRLLDKGETVRAGCQMVFPSAHASNMVVKLTFLLGLRMLISCDSPWHLQLLSAIMASQNGA